MNESAVLQVAAPVAIAVAGAAWAIVRYELNRYAAAHPNAPAVKDAQAVVKDAQVAAGLFGITPQKVAGFIAGALSAHGHVVPAQAVLATEQAVAAAANADLARVATQAGSGTQTATVTPQSPPAAPAAPAPAPTPTPPAAPAPAAQ